MFGYITVNKPELKIREYDTYQSYYCGLCKELKERHGVFSRISLSYDMNFLVLLLTGLYEPDTTVQIQNCLLHPFEKKPVRRNAYTKYAADMNLLLAYYKCRDDWQDDRRYARAAYGKILNKEMKRLRGRYPDKIREIEALLGNLAEKERLNENDIDKMADFSGKLLGTVFTFQNDIWEEDLYKTGFYLGKFIYLCDAYEDIKEDVKKGRYNPFARIYQDKHFDEISREHMTMMMAQCCKAFEKLPIIEHVEILRNILYSGVWNRYERARNKREEGREKNG